MLGTRDHVPSSVGDPDHIPGPDRSGADALLERVATATVDELLELVRVYAGMDVAFVGEFTRNRRIIRFVQGEVPSATTLVDRSHSLGESYCRLIAERKIPFTIPDVRELAELRSLPITSELDIGSYVGVPIHLSSGELYGTLCGFGHDATTELPEDLVRLLDVVASFLARRLEAPANRFVDVLAIQEKVQAVVDEPACLSMVYQPIVGLGSGTTVGYEALSRFPGQVAEPPDVWFADAHDAGLGVALEMASARRALEALEILPSDTYLSINLCAEAITAENLAELLDGVDPQRIVIELTEIQPDRGVHLPDARQQMRSMGVRLAVDDLGSGFAGLSRLLDMKPEIVKFDRFLTIGVSEDPRRSALASAALRFCAQTGADLIAEGVETPEDDAALTSLGVPFGQGYLLGVAAPAGDVRGRPDGG